MRNPHGKHIVKKNIKNKRKQRKERAKCAKLHFGEKKQAVSYLIYSDFVSTARATMYSAKEIFWFLLLKIKIIKFQLKVFAMRWKLLWSRTKKIGDKDVGNKGTDYTTLRFKVSLNAKRKKMILKINA